MIMFLILAVLVKNTLFRHVLVISHALVFGIHLDYWRLGDVILFTYFGIFGYIGCNLSKFAFL